MLTKFFPSFFKNYIKSIIKFPIYIYQNVYTYIKVEDYHKGNFDKFHQSFSKKDGHLQSNTEVTRFRNYINYKFADLALKNNPEGSFLSVGISYGTSLKVITHLLNHKANNNNYFAIDNYKNAESTGLDPEGQYNKDINNVKKDLKDIKNFKFVFIEDLLSKNVLNRIDDNLTFVHLNTGDFTSEYSCLDQIINKCVNNGILIIDNYGWLDIENQKKYDEYFRKKNFHLLVLPSLQMVVTIK